MNDYYEAVLYVINLLAEKLQTIGVGGSAGEASHSTLVCR